MTQAQRQQKTFLKRGPTDPCPECLIDQEKLSPTATLILFDG